MFLDRKHRTITAAFCFNSIEDPLQLYVAQKKILCLNYGTYITSSNTAFLTIIGLSFDALLTRPRASAILFSRLPSTNSVLSYSGLKLLSNDVNKDSSIMCVVVPYLLTSSLCYV